MTEGNVELKVSTSDLGCAAAMVASGQQVRDVDGADLQRVRFVFDNNDKARRIMRGYFLNEVQVDALRFYNCMRTLRARIFDVQKGGRQWAQ